MKLDLPGSIPLPNVRWTLTARLLDRDELPDGWMSNPDPYTAYLDAAKLQEPLILRPRQPGDRIVPLGMKHHQRVSDLMINLKVPRYEREQVPLLVSGGEIAWVVGLRVAEACSISDKTEQVLVIQFRQDLT